MNKGTIITAILGVATHAHAEIKLGDMGSVGFGLETTIRSTSNVILDETQQDDTIYSFMPKAVFRSDQGAASIEAYAGLNIIRYHNLNNNDSENIKSGITILFPDEPQGENYSLKLNAAYNQNTNANSALLSVIETENIALSATGNYFISEYVSLRSGLSYLENTSQTAGFADTSTLTWPIAMFYKYDEALSLGTGYRYRRSEVSNVTPVASSDDHAFYIGVEDLISPLLQYELQWGYQYRDFDNDQSFENLGGVYAEAILSWYATQRSIFMFNVGNEFGTSAANQSSETFSTSIQWMHKFDERLSTTLGAEYQDIAYKQIIGTRNDEDYSAFLNAEYKVLDDNMILRARLRYADHSSSLDAANYDVIEASISCFLLF
ncbi:outer membrane beta-barrel protein [Coraliomargarita algicola]|uniref:Outer membrane beta-barrel protein n=1 Tax=Coraliomargarita algicola TaxID=3092156 RepID=A0ABZ0RQD6_9BACT|nr:outer membrane beta-barrel protein [Coraliomargarita sp. J2-16]WPJ97363.1 outer membrane beta-barrel protein [Coraliomargarita sp. J2-16]